MSRARALDLAIGAIEWTLAAAVEAPGGLTWPGRADDEEINPTLYSGGAGVVLALLEAYAQWGDERYAEAARRGAGSIAAEIEDWSWSGLYLGLGGMAFALRAVGAVLGDRDADTAADRALAIVRGRFDGERWGDQFELIGGNAGIALGALAVGDVDLALLAVEPYRHTVESTPRGVQWEVRRGTAARFHHVSHGTLGIAMALAAVGSAADRPDLLDLALAGAADVVSRNEAGPDGFLVPHSDPQHRPELIERFSYGWCHGPAGDAQAFRLLASVTGDASWSALIDRCWRSVVTSGLPERRRPGFWDNNARCCGTAGVLALALDRYAEGPGDLTFADVLVADLADRATIDGAGVRWSNVEHRETPSTLLPRTGWAMGTAGIVRELLRYARDGGPYAIPLPDHPPLSSSGGVSC